METAAIFLLGLVLCYIFFTVVLQAFPPSPPTILILFVVAGLLGYGLHLELHRTWDPALNATQEREILIERSVESVFESCLLAPRFLPFLRRLDGDPGKGLLSGTALTMDDESVIVISLEKISSGKTRVRVASHTPGKPYNPPMILEWNRHYIDSICDFLLHPVGPKDLALMAWPFATEDELQQGQEPGSAIPSDGGSAAMVIPDRGK